LKYQGCAAFSPDSKWLATVDETGLCLRDTSNWNEVRRASGAGIPQFSPDGQILAVLKAPQSAVIQLLDAHTLEEIADLEAPEAYTPASYVFSPDTTRFAQFTNYAGIVFVWDLRTLRNRLATMKLDWNLPQFPEENLQSTRRHWSVSISTRPNTTQ
jgi:WD40 repeat protein